MKLFSRRSATEPLDRLPFLDGVDLSDSFVRSWVTEQDVLVFHLDASLWPSNPRYVSPHAGEHTCYKAAALTFLGVERLSLPTHGQVAGAYDAVENGYDTIDVISYNAPDHLWSVSVGALDFTFGCSGVRFDITAA